MDKVERNNIFTPTVATLYFGAIIALLLFWSDGNIPGALRYPFTLLPFLPAIFVDRRWFWPSFIVTLTVFNNMPGQQFIINKEFYFAIIAIVAIYHTIRERQVISPLEFLPFALCVAYMSAIDYGSGDDITNNQYWWLCVCALLTLRPKPQDGVPLTSSLEHLPQKDTSANTDNFTIYGAYAFILTSIIVSIVYTVNFDTYAEKYNFTSDLMRSNYIDQNYQGGALGMGIIFAIYLLLNAKTKTLWIQVMCWVGIILPMAVLFVLASRGALLAVVVAGSFLLLVSRAKLPAKISFILLGILLLAYAYSHNYMDLLIVRMQEESLETGSHRTDIWVSKIDAFSRDNNILHWLFGIGRMNSLKLGHYHLDYDGAAFHNQYLAMLVNYGIVGFCGFISLMVIPIFKAEKGKKVIVSILILYLATICMTLEPLTTAFPAFYLFYFYTYIFATRYLSRRDEESKRRRVQKSKSS